MSTAAPLRDTIIDALALTRLSDYAGTDIALIEQAADAVLRAIEHVKISDMSSERVNNQADSLHVTPGLTWDSEDVMLRT